MRFLIAALSIAGLLISAIVAKADKRVAFVVGNGAYKNVATLPNAPIDAKSMAKVLRNVGFDVVEGTNLTRDKMTERLLEFGKKAEGADVALFFYAGHGIAINGTNSAACRRRTVGHRAASGPPFCCWRRRRGGAAVAKRSRERRCADNKLARWADRDYRSTASKKVVRWRRFSTRRNRLNIKDIVRVCRIVPAYRCR